MPRQDLDFIADILARAVEGGADAARVRNALALRAQMHEAINKGEAWPHYRMTWMSDSVEKVIECAQKLCSEFTAQHTDDAATFLDLQDILTGALNIIIQHNNQKA